MNIRHEALIRITGSMEKEQQMRCVHRFEPRTHEALKSRQPLSWKRLQSRYHNKIPNGQNLAILNKTSLSILDFVKFGT